MNGNSFFTEGTSLSVDIFKGITAIASQGFIDDSHLDLFLRNAYIKRDYRDGLPDKAEWGSIVGWRKPVRRQ
jgi:hypothetical protein